MTLACIPPASDLRPVRAPTATCCSARRWLAGALAAAAAAPAFAQTERLSVDSNGVQGNGQSYFAATTGDGRLVAFVSLSSTLVQADTNGARDVFLRDRRVGSTIRVSLGAGAVEANGDSYSVAISADGRLVAFESDASNLVPGDTNGNTDIFVRNVEGGWTQRVSVGLGGTQANGPSMEPTISGDGRFVTFRSMASNLVLGDTNGFFDVFVYDRYSGAIERVSVGSAGGQADGESYGRSISWDGRYVPFFSTADNLVAGGGAPIFGEVFLRDRLLGTTERISVGSAGEPANGISYAHSISADGRYVSFWSLATNLVPGGTNGLLHVFVRDRLAGATELVSVSSSGAQGDQDSRLSGLSSDGRYVVFSSSATNLAGPDTNGFTDIFVRDRIARTTRRVSVGPGGLLADGDCEEPTISGDGSVVAYRSLATNLVFGDTNAESDIFAIHR